MSTIVDKSKSARERRPRSSAEETRARVLKAARLAFCRASFDHVGVREIAAAAGTDPAIVIRLFGSKDALFQVVADTAFSLEAAFEGPPAQMGEAIAALLFGDAKRLPEPDEFDAFRFLLNAAPSPAASAIASACLHASFVGPLARHLGGKDATGRAALVTACVLGFTTMRFALDSPALQAAHAGRLRKPFAQAIQACIDTAGQ